MLNLTRSGCKYKSRFALPRLNSQQFFSHVGTEKMSEEKKEYFLVIFIQYIKQSLKDKK